NTSNRKTNPMAEANQNQAAKSPILGKPCPECGCPDPGDHTQECSLGAIEAYLRERGMIVDIRDGASVMAGVIMAGVSLKTVEGLLLAEAEIDRLRNLLRNLPKSIGITERDIMGTYPKT